MAKKSSGPAALTFRDLVLGSDADTLRQALEARVRIDELIAERQAAYERIAALETQVEDVIGEPGVFPFPAPPLPVAGLDPKADGFTRAASAASASSPAPKRGPGRGAAAAATSATPAPVGADDSDDEDTDDDAPESPATEADENAGDNDGDGDENENVRG